MRNRGVEIYMLNEKENEYRNSIDIKSLISHEGLENISHIESLLNLHDFICDLILGEKPNINELLRASTLISQQIQHGSTQLHAFYNTIMEIYYKTRSNVEFNCNDFDTVIKTEIEKVLTNQATKLKFYDGVTVKTNKLHVSSDLEKIKQQAAVLNYKNQPDREKFLLIHFYTMSSCEDLRMRFYYCDHNQDLSKKLYKFVESFPIEFKDFPIDSRWIPETNYPKKCYFSSNKLILGLHFITNLHKELTDYTKRQGQLSLRDYMTHRQQNTLPDQFNDVLVDEFLNLIEEYNNFLLGVVRDSIELSDESVIKILELLSWRFVFYRCTIINVRKMNTNQKYLALTNLKVHYRWFVKYSVNSVIVLLNKQLPTELENIIGRINKSLEKQFSLLHKFSKKYQKFSHKPPPKVNNLEIELATCLNKISKKPLVLQSYDSRKEIFDSLNDLDKLKVIESSEFNSNLDQYQEDLLPIFDYFVKLQLKKCLLSTDVPEEELKSCLTVPIDLVTSLLQFSRSKDARLCHDLFRSYFSYLASSDRCFAPVLTLNLSSLLVSCTNSTITKFGNFSELMKQHRQLSLILWRNLQQFHENHYDYLSAERNFVCESFQSFIEALSQSLNTKNESFPELVKICLEKLEVLRDCGDLSESFLAHLRNCSENYFNLESCDDFDLSLLYVCELHMELSYVKAVLNSRLPLIDPSAKKALKKKYCGESVANFEDLRESFVDVNRVLSGNDKTLHSHYKFVVEMIQSLNDRNEQLGNYVAVRPKEVVYDEVVKVRKRKQNIM